jgi:regulatory protein
VAAGQLSLKGRALRLLSQREHSRLELERKLAAHAQDEPAELPRILDELQAKGFINEGRVIESVLHRRAPRLGTQRIRQELRAKGVEGDALAEALGRLRETELDRARDVWRRRFGEPPADPQARARQARFLAARGFGGEVIRKVLQDGE